MIIKPPLWAFDQSFIAPEWGLIQNSIVVEVPFWERSGRPIDLGSRIISNELTAGLWETTLHGAVLELLDNQGIDWAENAYNAGPSSAITCHVLLKSRGGADNFGIIFTKRYAQIEPFNAYALAQNGFNVGQLDFSLAIAGTRYTTAKTLAIPTDRFVNIFGFWQSGSDPTIEVRELDGSIFNTQVHGTNRSGVIDYGGNTYPNTALKINHGNTVLDGNFNAEYSIVRVANRMWSPSERRAVAINPFGPFEMLDDYAAWRSVVVAGGFARMIFLTGEM